MSVARGSLNLHQAFWICLKIEASTNLPADKCATLYESTLQASSLEYLNQSKRFLKIKSLCHPAATLVHYPLETYNNSVVDEPQLDVRFYLGNLSCTTLPTPPPPNNIHTALCVGGSLWPCWGLSAPRYLHRALSFKGTFQGRTSIAGHNRPSQAEFTACIQSTILFTIPSFSCQIFIYLCFSPLQ